MTESTGPRRLFVDWNRVGNAVRFSVPLTVNEAAGLAVGDLIVLVGDDVEDRPARVVSLDGLDATFELHSPHTPRGTDPARPAGLDDDQLDTIAEQGWHAVHDNPPQSHLNILGHLILSLVEEVKARQDSGRMFPLQLAVELDEAGDYAFAVGARAALDEYGFLPSQLVDSALRRLERRAGSWLERNATPEEVSAHEEQLRTLAAEMGLSGFETRDDGLVVVHSDEAGYRSVARFATGASRVVGAWVQVVTDDSDAGHQTKTANESADPASDPVSGLPVVTRGQRVTSAEVTDALDDE